MPVAAAATTDDVRAPIDGADELMRGADLTEDRSVAIVHDYLNQCGGAERVALELSRIWPSAPIYTSIYRPHSTFREFLGRDVRTTPLQWLPIDRSFRGLAPLYPAAFRMLGALDHDIVISSSSGWAHGVRTAPGTTHVVYCHTPARWLYAPSGYLGRNSHSQALLGLLSGYLRRWDQDSARSATAYIVNAENVRARVREIYGIDPVVVHPPVEVERFTPTPRGERLLVVSRLLPYKRVDLAIRAARLARLPLDVVGTGPALHDLEALAGSSVVFHGACSDTRLTALLQGCSALCVPGAEDFGIAPLEANAAGKPVVALARGGALETVIDGVTGCLFDEPTPGALLDALHRLDALPSSPSDLRRHAEGFSRAAFGRRFTAALQQILAQASSR